MAPTKKLAIIRSEETRACPFGLPIAAACRSVGTAIDNMMPLAAVDKEKREHYQRSNKRIMLVHHSQERCPYADKIVEGKEVVDCDFGDGGARLSDTPMKPSPYYPRIFNGLGQYGLYGYPISHWTDDQAARQVFTGIFSIYASTGEILIQKRNLPPDPVLERLANELSPNNSSEDQD